MDRSAIYSSCRNAHAAGRLQPADRLKIEAIETEGVCVKKYGESDVTDGPRKGQRGKSGSFVSKRLKNKWYNVSGLSAKDESNLSIMEFTRIFADQKR